MLARRLKSLRSKFNFSRDRLKTKSNLYREISTKLKKRASRNWTFWRIWKHVYTKYKQTMRKFVRRSKIKYKSKLKLKLISQEFPDCIIIRKYLKWKLGGGKPKGRVRKYVGMLLKLKRKLASFYPMLKNLKRKSIIFPMRQGLGAKFRIIRLGIFSISAKELSKKLLSVFRNWMKPRTKFRNLRRRSTCLLEKIINRI